MPWAGIPHNLVIFIVGGRRRMPRMNKNTPPADDDARQRRALARFAAVQMVLQARQRGLPLYRALQEAGQQPWDGRLYSAETIEDWVYRFQHGNFPALYDQRRRDK